MENSFKTFFVILALVMTFVMVQTAWSGILDVGDIIEITGIFSECEAGEGFKVDTDEGIITIYGMGPASYWESVEVDFPQPYELVSIWAFEITFSDGTTKLVAKEVDLGADGASILNFVTMMVLPCGGKEASVCTEELSKWEALAATLSKWERAGYALPASFAGEGFVSCALQPILH